MNIIIEYVFINPELDGIKNIKKDTIKEYLKKYDNSYWKRCEYKCIIQFFDKIKNKTKNITTNQGVKRTIIASNGRYDYIGINKSIILIEGDIKKNVIRTYMKSDNIPLLWRKFFLNIANNRDYIINYCKRPFNKFDKHCREWYLNHYSYDNEIRVFDDNINNMFYAFTGCTKTKQKRTS